MPGEPWANHPCPSSSTSSSVPVLRHSRSPRPSGWIAGTCATSLALPSKRTGRGLPRGPRPLTRRALVTKVFRLTGFRRRGDNTRPDTLISSEVVERQIVASRIGGPGWWLVLMAASCSSACSRDAVDRQRDPGHGETPRRVEQRTFGSTWTRRVCVDGGRFTHNPEVAGSNPGPRYQAKTA
jgi:hypothetical protein